MFLGQTVFLVYISKSVCISLAWRQVNFQVVMPHKPGLLVSKHVDGYGFFTVCATKIWMFLYRSITWPILTDRTWANSTLQTSPCRAKLEFFLVSDYIMFLSSPHIFLFIYLININVSQGSVPNLSHIIQWLQLSFTTK